MAVSEIKSGAKMAQKQKKHHGHHDGSQIKRMIVMQEFSMKVAGRCSHTFTCLIKSCISLRAASTANVTSMVLAPYWLPMDKNSWMAHDERVTDFGAPASTTTATSLSRMLCPRLWVMTTLPNASGVTVLAFRTDTDALVGVLNKARPGGVPRRVHHIRDGKSERDQPVRFNLNLQLPGITPKIIRAFVLGLIHPVGQRPQFHREGWSRPARFSASPSSRKPSAQQAGSPASNARSTFVQP